MEDATPSSDTAASAAIDTVRRRQTPLSNDELYAVHILEPQLAQSEETISNLEGEKRELQATARELKRKLSNAEWELRKRDALDLKGTGQTEQSAIGLARCCQKVQRSCTEDLKDHLDGLEERILGELKNAAKKASEDRRLLRALVGTLQSQQQKMEDDHRNQQVWRLAQNTCVRSIAKELERCAATLSSIQTWAVEDSADASVHGIADVGEETREALENVLRALRDSLV